MGEQRKRRLITIYLFAFMAAFAVSGTMFSTALPRIIEDYGLTLEMAGLFPAFSSAGQVLAMVLTGLVGDKFKKSALAGATFLMMGLMLLSIFFMPPFAVLLILMALLGVSTSALNLIVTAYVSDLYGRERARYINLVHVCFGVGSLLGPLYPMLLGKLGLAWRHAYLGLSVAVLITGAGYFWRLARGREPARADAAEKKRAPAARYRDLLGNRSLIALCAMGFLYMGGHQSAFSTWCQTYLQWKDPVAYPEAYTSVLMTVYWIGMVASRLVGASLPKKITARAILLVGSAVGIAALTAGLLVDQNAFWMAAAALLGLATGVVYPLTLALSCEWFPDSSARVTSFVGIFTSLGNMFFGWLMGTVAARSFPAAMWIPVAALGAAGCIIYFVAPPDGGAPAIPPSA